MHLGDRVRSKVTGFTGIATAHVTYLFHCERVLVQPPVDKDGKDVDAIWIDVDEAEVVERAAVTGGGDWGIRPAAEDEPRHVRAATGGGADPSDRKREL